MKHFYFLLFTVAFNATVFAQQPIITAIIDGDCTGGNPKVVEIFASGTVDFTQFTFELQTNANTNWASPTSLAPFGTRTNSFVYITTTGSAAAIATEFPSINATNSLTTGAANFNGDDRVRIIDAAMATVDQFGESSTSGTGQAWEYIDSFAKRVSGTGPESTFNPASWSYGGVRFLDNQGVCQGGSITFETLIGGLGTYSSTANTNPLLTITAPTNGASLNSATTTVDVTWSTQNVPAGATYNISVNGTTTTGVTSPFAVPVQTGGSYAVIVSMINGGATVTSDTINFSVAFPCNLQVGTITTTCQTSTAGVDLYDVSIAYTGGGSTTYAISTNGNGTLGGDNPSTTANGTITITGVTEGTNFTVTFTGDPANSSCNFSRSITGPTCVGNVVCVNPGDIIITEIMKNPAAVADNLGEYIEIYNTTNAPINMQGFVLRDDLTANERHTISNLILPANGYAVLGLSNNITINGGMVVDYVYDTVNLGNGADGVAIECNGTLIDEVIYDTGAGATFPNGNGASMELALSKYNAADNDLGANWGLATVAFGAGDLGTPGAANTFTLSNLDVALQNFRMYPNPLTSGQLSITTNNGDAVNVTIYTMLGQEVLHVKGVTQILDASALTAGMYIVKVTQGSSTISQKLIVE